MADFPATGRWVIYSVQKTLPIIGRIGAVFGAHNYLALIDPDGHIDSEMHGVYTDGFAVNGPVAGNYLHVRMYREHGYMEPQSVLEVKPVFFGREEDMRRLLHTGYREVAKSLDRTRMLYDGAEIVGHAVNSNSVWYTALRAMGVEDPSQFDGWGSTPGNSVDLRQEPSNNQWFATSEDLWVANPAFTSRFPEARYLPPTSEVLAPEPEPSEPPTNEIEAAIVAEQELLSQRMQDIEAILNAIDEGTFPTDRDVIDGFLDDLGAQLDSLGTLSGTDLLDRLNDLVDRLSEWREYLQGQLDADSGGGVQDDQDNPPDDWRGDEESEEWEEPPTTFNREDECEPEPEYAWSDPGMQTSGDEDD